MNCFINTVNICLNIARISKSAPPTHMNVGGYLHDCTDEKGCKSGVTGGDPFRNDSGLSLLQELFWRPL